MYKRTRIRKMNRVIKTIGWMIFDALVVVAVFCLPLITLYQDFVDNGVLVNWFIYSICCALFLVLFQALFGLYRIIPKYIDSSDIFYFVLVVGCCAVLFFCAMFFIPQIPIISKAYAICLSFVLETIIVGSRLMKKIFKSLTSDLTSKIYPIKTLIVGATDMACTIIDECKYNQKINYYIVGLLDDNTNFKGMNIAGKKVLGDIASIKQHVVKLGINEVLVALKNVSDDELNKIVSLLDGCNVEVRKVLSVEETLLCNPIGQVIYSGKELVEGEYFLKPGQTVYLVFKRLIGFIGAVAGIVICFIPMLIITIINLFATKGHPFFTQKRMGRNKKEFRVIKFRSMRYDAPTDMAAFNLADSESYCTKFGLFLRKTSLDEIPQLFNILLGQMAFIGPRPLINKGVDLETINERNKNGSYHLRPGISGLAQVRGRVNVEPGKKGEFDGEYYQKIGFALDAKIFLLSILKAVRGKDITSR